MKNALSRRDFLKFTAAAALTTAFVRWGKDYINEASATNKLPPLSDDMPNVLLIVVDTLRALNLSLYGYERPTSPNLEQFAKKSVLFRQVIATSPWTLPSHASMFTGHYPHVLSADWESPLDDTYPTLAEILSQHGYSTAGFAANTMYCDYEHGLNRGFIHYEDYKISLSEIIRSSAIGRKVGGNIELRKLIGYYNFLGRVFADEINESCIKWLSKEDGHPFFVFLNYMDTHLPYVPPADFLLFGSRERPFYPVIDPNTGMPESEIRKYIDSYDDAIAYVDHQIGLLLNELEKMGRLDNTLVIITSDHGEELGDHRLFSHGGCLYWSSLFVPLMICFPNKIPAGVVFDDPVSLRNIGATILDLLQITPGQDFPGKSLAQFWNGFDGKENRWKDVLLSELSKGVRTPPEWRNSLGDMKSLLAEGFHLILNGDGSEELYDIKSDPWEKDNLSLSSAHRSEVSGLKRLLEVALK